MDFHVLKNSIVINSDGESHTVDSSHKFFSKIKKLLFDGKFDAVKKFFTSKAKVEVFISKPIAQDFELKQNSVLYKGTPVEPFITKKLIEFIEKKEPITYLLNFIKRLENNPEASSRKQLFNFLNNQGFPITEDGRFIAYKSVTSAYMDKHSGKIKYEFGVPTKMDRKDVASTPSCACGTGLHVGTYSYAKSFGGGSDKLIEVLVDPEHVVSVPNDTNNSKCRCCEVLPLRDYDKNKTGPKEIAVDHTVQKEVKVEPEKKSSTKKKGTKTKVIKSKEKTFKIGNYNYKSNEITIQSTIDTLISVHEKLKPSKWAKYFLSLDCVETLWKLTDKGKSTSFLIKTNDNTYILYTIVE